jgi:hypothetical protein
MLYNSSIKDTMERQRERQREREREREREFGLFIKDQQ